MNKKLIDTTPPPICNQIEDEPGSIQASLDILGDKWSPVLLGQLVSADKTFGELELALKGVSPRTLSSRLDKLEAELILTKKLYCEHPPRYKYSLTKKGHDLRGILARMADWGKKYSA